ncbi:transglycosylase domain-containing protein [Longispora sp. K20-0274]|uniref:transglycosylase domain-containing protein n=1 Tax=Longispora sp. K20-0274 TaxID=3088255 RepID=UPI0039996D6A
MSDYPPERPTGRASVPGLTPASPHDQPAPGGYEGGYREPESGYREHGSGYEEPYQAPVTGRATVGRATVGAPPPPPAPGAAGRASVAGAAPVGLDEIKAVSGRGKGPIDPKKRKKRRRRNRIVALIAVILMLTGLAFIGGTYYFTSVPLPNELALAQISRVYSADGQLIGQIGDENRTVVEFADISKGMKDAMVAAEDRSFYQNSGVDFKGMIRALWNNLTGGSQQGASTITQQYARIAADLNQDSSYTRKAKEAVIAMKLDKEYTKDQILGFYLNTVDFGRGTSGVEAASKSYFGISAKELKPEQAAVIAGMVKSPGGYYEPDDKDTHQNAVDRWGYVMDSMVETGAITKEYRAAAKFPEVKPNVPLGEFWKKPIYQIVKYVKEEMAALGKNDLQTGGYNITTSVNMAVQAEAEKAAAGNGKGEPMQNQDPRAMAALVATDPKTGRVLAYYGGPDGTGSDYAGYTKTVDKNDPTKVIIGGDGFHPLGSTAKVYVMADILKEGWTVNSRWDASSPMDFPDQGRTKALGNPVTNSGNDNSCGKGCTIRDATVKSLNTPYFAMTAKVGAGAVLNIMRESGVQYMTPAVTEDGKPRPNVDITKQQISEMVPNLFQNEIGIGQYPVTVLQHSAGFATFANAGVSVKQHFVTKVEKDKKVIFDDAKDLIPKAQKRVVEAPVAAAMADVLQGVKPNAGPVQGRQAAAKTGTWQVDDGKRAGENGDVWITGYTPQISTAVWVGPKKDRIPLYVNTSPSQPFSETSHHAQMYGSSLPGSIWKTFMENAHSVLKLKPEPFPKATPIGDPNKLGNGQSPTPSAPPGGTTVPCPWGPLLCPGGAGGATPAAGNGGGNGPGNGPGGGHGDVAVPATVPTTRRR